MSWPLVYVELKFRNSRRRAPVSLVVNLESSHHRFVFMTELFWIWSQYTIFGQASNMEAMGICNFHCLYIYYLYYQTFCCNFHSFINFDTLEKYRDIVTKNV